MYGKMNMTQINESMSSLTVTILRVMESFEKILLNYLRCIHPSIYPITP